MRQVSRWPRSMRTQLAAIAFAALFSTVATQIYTLIVPTRSALWLLLLFFMVGLGVAWLTIRIDAREAREEKAKAAAQSSPAAETTAGADVAEPPQGDAQP